MHSVKDVQAQLEVGRLVSPSLHGCRLRGITATLVGASGALGTKAGHPSFTTAVLRTCRVASRSGLTLGCAAEVSQQVRGQREDNCR